MLVDARGVLITAGDTAIWGFGVGRSIAMAEGVVMAEKEGFPYPAQTKTGRIKLRVVRRSYDSGEKPVVDVARDRLIVLKPVDGPFQPGTPEPCFALPDSPLSTQADEARAKLKRSLANYTASMGAEVAPKWMERMPFPVDPADAERVALAEYLAFCGKELAILRRKLRDLDG